MKCPGCEGVTVWVEGRSEWWCNQCLSGHAGEPPAASVGPMPSGTGEPAGGAGVRSRGSEGAVRAGFLVASLVVLVPILVVGFSISAILWWLDQSTAAWVVAGLSVVIAWLFG